MTKTTTAIIYVVIACVIGCRSQDEGCGAPKGHQSVQNAGSSHIKGDAVSGAVAIQGDAASLYERLLSAECDEDYLWSHVDQVRAAFRRAAPKNDPPIVRKQPTASDVLWSTIADEELGGRWEERLPSLYAQSKSGTFETVCKSCGDMASRFYWYMLKSSQSKSDIECLWATVAVCTSWMTC